MLTTEALYAVLLGLPSKRLEHLKETAWGVLCWRIERHLAKGRDPLAALKEALQEAGEWEREQLRTALTHALPVMGLPGLSYRQKLALIALRYAKCASLTQLSHILMADRGNTHRRLQALVQRGYAIRFAQPGGVFYMAVAAPLSKEIKRGVQDILDQLIKDLSKEEPHTTPTKPTNPAQPT